MADRQHSSVSPLIARVLANEALYGDGPPTWEKAVTAAEAGEARRAYIKRLRRLATDYAEAAQLADILEQCKRHQRCMSGACPECVRGKRRWFVPQIDDLGTAADVGELHSISVIFPKYRTAEDQLASLDTTNMKRSVFEAIKNIDGLAWMAGGIDLSLNDDTQRGHGIYWQPQLYAIAYAHANVKTLSNVFRDKFRGTELVRRPVYIKKCDGTEEAISYAFKADFVRRIAYLTEVGKPEKRRMCWHTRKVYLQPCEHVQAMLWMHKVGLHGRLFLHGLRMIRSGDGVRLVEIRRRE